MESSCTFLHFTGVETEVHRGKDLPRVTWPRRVRLVVFVPRWLSVPGLEVGSRAAAVSGTDVVQEAQTQAPGARQVTSGSEK